MTRYHNLQKYIFVCLITLLTVWLILVSCRQANASETFIWPTLSVVAPNEPPSNYIDEKGKITGFSTEVVEAIMDELGQNWPVQILPWSRIYHQAQIEPNVVLFRAARLELREELFQWVGPLTIRPAILYAKSDSTLDIQSIDEAKNVKLVAVMRNDFRQQMLTKLNFTNLDQSYDHTEGLLKLLNGRVDLWASADIDSRKQLEKINQPADAIKPLITFGHVFGYIVVSKGTEEEVVRRWQQALDRLKENGTFETLAKKWASIQGIDVQFEQSAAQFIINKE